MSESIIINTFYVSKEKFVESFLEKKANIEQYKRIGIKLENGSRHDFSHWMYSVVEITKGGGTKFQKYRVNPDSFEQSRYIFVDGVIRFINKKIIGDIHLSNILFEINSFFQWLQKSGMVAPNSVEKARKIYGDYTTYLLSVVMSHNPEASKKGSFGGMSAHRKQLVLRYLFIEAFEVKECDIVGFIENIKKRTHNDSTSFVGNDKERDGALSYYFQFFDQVANFLLDEKEYPYRIELMGNSAILTTDWSYKNVITKDMKSIHLKPARYFDFNTGYLLEEEEALKCLKHEKDWKKRTANYRRVTKKNTVNTMRSLIENFKSANFDRDNHPDRHKLGLRAMKAYFMVLLDVTGMNDSTLATVKWEDDEFLSEVSQQSFRNIKRRAGNKEVVFEIQSTFMGSFRKFIKLRRFVLNGYDYEYLFFVAYGKKAKISKDQIRGAFGKECYAAHKSLWPELFFTGSRSNRQSKNRWLMKHTNGNIYLSSSIMQHKPNTNQINYPPDTEEEKQEQMGNYLIFMQEKVKNGSSEGITTSVGECESQDHTPISDLSDIAIKPDCTNPMTCLFCAFYRIVPDEENIWKIISLEYVIQEITIINARSQVHFDLVMGPILKRIEVLLKAIARKVPETEGTIKELHYNVYDKQNIHWYWEKRLELLWKMGVV